jgi:hydroxyacylglutathione hydrolase
MTSISRWLLIGWLAAAAAPAMAQDSPTMHWDPGAEDCDASKQKTEVHGIGENTFAIRQNPCVDFEAPIMYLLIGSERALLIDSGATDDPRLTAELTALVSSYLEYEDGTRLPLVVAHTHGHQDHRSGDAAFAALPDTTVVPYQGEAMREFFEFEDWPEQAAEFDLGDREIVVIPTPGHHPDHVVFFDTDTSLLFSGDFLLPGRLLVEDIEAYHLSALVMSEVSASHGIRHALGAHIEMNSAGELYSSGSTFHPDERQVAIRFEIADAVALRRDLAEFNGFYLSNYDRRYVIVNPTHILAALAVGVVVALALVTWLIVRLRRRARARRIATAQGG